MEQVMLSTEELEVAAIAADAAGADRFELESIAPHPWGVYATFTVPEGCEVDGFGLVLYREAA